MKRIEIDGKQTTLSAAVRAMVSDGLDNRSIYHRLGRHSVSRSSLIVIVSLARKKLGARECERARRSKRIRLGERARQRLEVEAAARDVSFSWLAARLLEIIVDDGMIDNVLDGEATRLAAREA